MKTQKNILITLALALAIALPTTGYSESQTDLEERVEEAVSQHYDSVWREIRIWDERNIWERMLATDIGYIIDRISYTITHNANLQTEPQKDEVYRQVKIKILREGESLASEMSPEDQSLFYKSLNRKRQEEKLWLERELEFSNVSIKRWNAIVKRSIEIKKTIKESPMEKKTKIGIKILAERFIPEHYDSIKSSLVPSKYSEKEWETALLNDFKNLKNEIIPLVYSKFMSFIKSNPGIEPIPRKSMLPLWLIVRAQIKIQILNEKVTLEKKLEELAKRRNENIKAIKAKALADKKQPTLKRQLML